MPRIGKRIDVSNLVTALMETAERYPQRLAVQGADRALTYAGLDDFSARAAGGLLDHGVGPGDRVGLRLPHSPVLAVLYFGVLRAGAVAVPLDPGPRPLAVPLRRAACGARLVFSSPDTMAVQEIRAHDTTLVPAGADFLEQVRFWPRYDGAADRADHDPAVVVRSGVGARSARDALLSHGLLRETALQAGIPGGEQAPSGDRPPADESAPEDGRADAPVFFSEDQIYGLTALLLSGACLTAAGERPVVAADVREDGGPLPRRRGAGHPPVPADADLLPRGGCHR